MKHPSRRALSIIKLPILLSFQAIIVMIVKQRLPILLLSVNKCILMIDFYRVIYGFILKNCLYVIHQIFSISIVTDNINNLIKWLFSH